jgi:hypothetical protein
VCRARLPAAQPDEFEVIDEPPRRARVVASAPPVRPRPADYDEIDDRPRPRKSKSSEVRKSGGALKPLLIAGGAVALLGLVGMCGGVSLIFGDTILHPAPSGWTTASDAEGRYRVFLPGEVTSHDQAQRNGQAPGQVWVPPPYRGHFSVENRIRVHVESRPMLAGAAVPTAPEDLVELADVATAGWEKREKLTPVRLGGRAGVELRTFHNDAWMDEQPPGVSPPPDWLPPAEKARQQEENRKTLADHAARKPERDRKAAAGRANGEHKVYYVVATEARLYVIEAAATGAYPEEGLLKIFRDSFVIR